MYDEESAEMNAFDGSNKTPTELLSTAANENESSLAFSSGNALSVSESVNIQDEENYRRSLVSILKYLRQESLYNVESFRKVNGNNLPTTDQLTQAAFCQLYDHLDNIEGVLLDILDVSPAYDFRNIKINGYRSLVKVTQSCLTRLTALVRYISVNKHSYLFRASHYTKELESYVMVLGQLRDVLNYTRKLMNYSPKGQLMPSEELLDTAVADEIQMEMDMIDQECFYGRALGFQYCDSMRRPFEVVHISLATYSHNYQSRISPYIKLASSLLTSTQYVMSAEQRAQKVVEVTLSCNIDFCKAFWSLSESDLLHNMARLALPTCPINHIFDIEPSDINIKNEAGQIVTVKSPSAHIGFQRLHLRLMSNCYRLGQDKLPNFPQQKLMANPPSDYLVIQCHGGGFVSQTSRTHEAYLRFWAKELKAPILCIDYSHAPAAPFPRALEEVYYAYAWALINRRKLGTTAKRIALVGDSAGGNLLFATVLRAIQDNLRLPDGLVAVYTPVYIQYIPSPSRTLSIMDALLPVGILTTCLEAYAGDLIRPWKGGSKQSEDGSVIEDSTGDIASASYETASGGKLLTASPLMDARDDEDDEDDEEIESFFRPRLASSQSTDSDELTQFYDCVDEDKFLADKLHPVIIRDPDISISTHRRFSHRRLTHSRSESLPVAPRVPHVDQNRHDRARHFAQSPLYKFAKIRIKQDPLLSPLHASDELLCKLPSTYLVACHLDPCLDDSVMFAKKLDSLGVDVHLDAVDEVPHGFLNFTLVSKECQQATELCRERLEEALHMKPD
ncbi:hormone-sensitive lipase-like [Watersipora subatra]|uniref:hormone-sensitive lipase-like n=1 Tax=Watersipora subatra TaxID=2589382 RepID=UPI00355C0539